MEAIGAPVSTNWPSAASRRVSTPDIGAEALPESAAGLYTAFACS